jgi:signal peptidase I
MTTNLEQVPPAAKATPPAPKSNIGEIVSFVKTLAIFLLAALVLRASVVEAFKIPSGSMIPTLRIHDHILVSKLSYGVRVPFMANSAYVFAQPQRGDIVVFTRPDETDTPLEDESDINIIKRVVGLPGDTVEVRDTKLYINNQPLEESYARWEEGGIREGNFGPEKIPAGHIFLLGDNRDHSRDSRFWQDPFLPIERVKGRAMIIYWSWDNLGRIGTVLR